MKLKDMKQNLNWFTIHSCLLLHFYVVVVVFAFSLSLPPSVRKGLRHARIVDRSHLHISDVSSLDLKTTRRETKEKKKKKLKVYRRRQQQFFLFSSCLVPYILPFGAIKNSIMPLHVVSYPSPKTELNVIQR